MTETFRRIVHRIDWVTHGFRYGVRNIIRWLPIIWRDTDYDPEPLMEMMEFKLRKMAAVQANGTHVGCERYARQMMVCAELLRRMRDGMWYWRNAQIRYGNTAMAAKVAMENEKNAGKYMGTIMGKFIQYWWE